MKCDGYRLIIQREGKRVRCSPATAMIKYPLIVESALRNRCSVFVIDGEAVLLGRLWLSARALVFRTAGVSLWLSATGAVLKRRAVVRRVKRRAGAMFQRPIAATAQEHSCAPARSVFHTWTSGDRCSRCCKASE